MYRAHRQKLTILVLCFTVVLETLTFRQSLLARAASEPKNQPVYINQQSDSAQQYNLHLPIILQPDSYTKATPIWAFDPKPASNEIVLFRHSFTLTEILENAELHIFADTRYEAWVDGVWIGRGPARFSRTLREYDILQLGQLPAGTHLIAVLVQWAPNNRRSESTTPFLQSVIQGRTSNGSLVKISSDPQWKALLSDAWRQDAVLVHSWELIGPTELLDLQRLPLNWMMPTYPDSHWALAVVKDISAADYLPHFAPSLDFYRPSLLYSGSDVSKNQFVTTFPAAPTISVSVETEYEWTIAEATSTISSITYQPRSIPQLVNQPISITVTDAGLLSPGYALGELVQPITEPYSLTLEASIPTVFTVETLIQSDVVLTETIHLDESALSWKPAGSLRPDVYFATANVNVGTHRLTFTRIPPTGLTFSVSRQGIEFTKLPFQQGIHAGRRLLLANPVSNPAMLVITSTQTIEAEFPSLPSFIVLDLGRTVYGRLIADVSGSASTVVDIGWDERLLTGTTRPLPFPGTLHPQWDQVDSWILDGTPRQISTIDARAGRYILIAVWGNATTHIRNVRVLEEQYPVTQQGEFHSSNPLLDQIWQVGVDTARVNMTDAYTDTPWRERGQWWGDAYITDHINRVAFGDTELLRRGILFMTNAFTPGHAPGMAPNNNGMNMIDYSMLWVHSLIEYSQQTNDVEFLRQTYPVLLQFIAQLASYENSTTSLLDLPQTHWSQSAYIETLGYNSRYGQSTAVNAMYYSTLLNAANIADLVNDPISATAWRAKAKRIFQQVNALLYLPIEHRYLTTIYNGQVVLPSPQAQAWALAYDLVPASEVESVASALMELLYTDPSVPNVEIYGTFWVLEALGHARHIPEAINLIENDYRRMLDLGATTWWEGFNAYRFYTASLSHSWGGSPTWFLTTYILGARRTGADSWVVKPAFEGVSEASGILPLQNGELHVSWKHPTCQDFSLQAAANAEAGGEVIIPFDSQTLIITHNGETIWRDGAPLVENITALDDGIHIALNGGNHEFSIHQDCSEYEYER